MGLALRPHENVAVLTEGEPLPFSLLSSGTAVACAGLDARAAAPNPLNSGTAVDGDEVALASPLACELFVVGSARVFDGTRGFSTTAKSESAASFSYVCSVAFIRDPTDPGTSRDRTFKDVAGTTSSSLASSSTLDGDDLFLEVAMSAASEPAVGPASGLKSFGGLASSDEAGVSTAF